MSGRKLSPAQAQVARILGGCDYCAAYQTVEPVATGMWSIGVHHDDGCPFLRRLEERAS